MNARSLFCIILLIVTVSSEAGPRINVKDFGATGSGVVNDTTAIQQAINFQRDQGGGEVYVPAGTYVAANLRLYSNITLLGDGPTVTILQHTGGNSYFLLSVNPGSGGTPNIADNQRNIIIRDLQLRGTVERDGFSQNRHLLVLSAISDALIENVHFIGMRGDGIYLASGDSANVERHNTDVVVRGCLFDGLINNNRAGISIIDGDKITIENNKFNRLTRPDMPAPINIEPNHNFFIARNITIHNNTFEKSNGLSVIQWFIPSLRSSRSSPETIRITHNMIAADNRIRNMAAIYIATAQQSSDPPMNVIIEDNVVLIPNQRPLTLSNVFNNVSVRRNEFRNGRASFIGIRWPDPTAVEDMVFSNNIVENVNEWTMMQMWNTKNTSITNNQFIHLNQPNPPPSALYFLYFRTNKNPDSNVTIANNEFYKGDNTYFQKITNWDYSDDPSRYYGNSLKDGVPSTANIPITPHNLRIVQP